MSNMLRTIKRNKAKSLGLDIRFFLDSYQERQRRRYDKELKKLQKLQMAMAELQSVAVATEAEEESGREV